MNKIFKDRSILLFIICLVEIAFCFWVLIVLFMLSLNFEDTFMNNFSNFLIFVPLVVVNIVAYFKQKKISLMA